MTDQTGGITPSYQDCLDAGMTTTEAARARGVSVSAASLWAKRNSVKFKRDYAANAERMRQRHKDPEFAAAHAERMRQMHKDPEFAAAHAERMRQMRKDPEFAAAHAERMRQMHKDPEFNPLVLLSANERADYDMLKKAHFSRDDALKAVGRADLCPS